MYGYLGFLCIFKWALIVNTFRWICSFYLRYIYFLELSSSYYSLINLLASFILWCFLICKHWAALIWRLERGLLQTPGLTLREAFLFSPLLWILATLTSVLINSSCYNRLPQTWWFKLQAFISCSSGSCKLEIRVKCLSHNIKFLEGRTLDSWGFACTTQETQLTAAQIYKNSFFHLRRRLEANGIMY